MMPWIISAEHSALQGAIWPPVLDPVTAKRGRKRRVSNTYSKYFLMAFPVIIASITYKATQREDGGTYD